MPEADSQRRSSTDTRVRLLEAAREAFSTLGYLTTRIDDIVSRAGTSHGTFYLYFKDKKAVLVGLTTEIAHSLYGAALTPLVETDRSSHPRDVVRARIASFLDIYRRHWGVIRSWTQAEGVHPDVEQAKSRIRQAIAMGTAELLERDKGRGLIAPDVRIDFVATALVAMTEGIANERLASGAGITDADVDDLADIWERVVYRA